MHTFAGIVDAICRHLESRGFAIIERGEGVPNIVAVKEGRHLLVKVTGQTNPGGKPFDDSQVKAHVARIVFDALKLNETKAKSQEIWLAMPDEPVHQKRTQEIAGSLRDLGIGVIWIGENGSLTPFA